MKKKIIFNFLYSFDNNQKVNISKALKLLDRTPFPKSNPDNTIYAVNDDTFIKYQDSGDNEDNIIGFKNNNGEFIQFIRLSEEEWQFDIPIQNLQIKSWTGVNLLLNDISTQIVKKIVKAFFEESDLIGLIREKFNAGKDPKYDNDDQLVIDENFKVWIDSNYG